MSAIVNGPIVCFSADEKPKIIEKGDFQAWINSINNIKPTDPFPAIENLKPSARAIPLVTKMGAASTAQISVKNLGTEPQTIPRDPFKSGLLSVYGQCCKEAGPHGTVVEAETCSGGKITLMHEGWVPKDGTQHLEKRPWMDLVLEPKDCHLFPHGRVVCPRPYNPAPPPTIETSQVDLGIRTFFLKSAVKKFEDDRHLKKTEKLQLHTRPTAQFYIKNVSEKDIKFERGFTAHFVKPLEAVKDCCCKPEDWTEDKYKCYGGYAVVLEDGKPLMELGVEKKDS
ncbi:unnamed protein product [Calypogeia fissa]